MVVILPLEILQVLTHIFLLPLVEVVVHLTQRVEILVDLVVGVDGLLALMMREIL
jgi:hypothetical protein